jgi:hypothetical protein
LKAEAPHQITAMNRKRESWIGAPKLYDLHRPLARNESPKALKSLDW